MQDIPRPVQRKWNSFRANHKKNTRSLFGIVQLIIIRLYLSTVEQRPSLTPSTSHFDVGILHLGLANVSPPDVWPALASITVYVVTLFRFLPVLCSYAVAYQNPFLFVIKMASSFTLSHIYVVRFLPLRVTPSIFLSIPLWGLLIFLSYSFVRCQVSEAVI